MESVLALHLHFKIWIMHITKGLIIGLFALSLGCSAQKDVPLNKRVGDPTAIPANNNQFAFDLYREIGSDNKKNLFFSPFSISTALSMTYAGADGQTAREMKEVLHFGENTPEFHEAYGNYLNGLNRNATNYVELNIANRLYPEQNFAFQSSFLKRVDKNYGAEVEKMNFRGNAEGSRIAINKWVEEQTKDRIKDLLPSGSVSPETRMVLVNAIYFKADWKTSFEKQLTQEEDFKKEGRGTVKALFMNARRNMPYTETGGYKMVRLPYKGNKQSMVVVLPKGIRSLSAVEKDFDFSKVDELYRGEQEVIFKMPKFEMTLPLSLTEPLKKMGMKEAFGMGANFSNMAESNNLAISDVIHKAFVKVDEEGTEAAAATAVTMVVTSISMQEPPQPKEFIANHPFMYFIIDDQTRSILFMGRMMDPS